MNVLRKIATILILMGGASAMESASSGGTKSTSRVFIQEEESGSERQTFYYHQTPEGVYTFMFPNLVLVEEEIASSFKVEERFTAFDPDLADYNTKITISNPTRGNGALKLEAMVEVKIFDQELKLEEEGVLNLAFDEKWIDVKTGKPWGYSPHIEIWPSNRTSWSRSSVNGFKPYEPASELRQLKETSKLRQLMIDGNRKMVQAAEEKRNEERDQLKIQLTQKYGPTIKKLQEEEQERLKRDCQITQFNWPECWSIYYTILLKGERIVSFMVPPIVQIDTALEPFVTQKEFEKEDPWSKENQPSQELLTMDPSCRMHNTKVKIEYSEGALSVRVFYTCKVYIGGIMISNTPNDMWFRGGQWVEYVNNKPMKYQLPMAIIGYGWAAASWENFVPKSL